MDWSIFFHNLLCGDASAISAFVSLIGLLFTATGIIMVIITFRSQSKINAAQLQLNELLMDKERRDIMPIFTIKSGSHGYDSEIGMHRFTLVLRNAVATDISYTTHSSRSEPVEQKFSILIIDETLSTQTRLKPNENKLVTVEDIEYSDSYGRRYIQQVTLDKWNDIAVTYPTLK